MSYFYWVDGTDVMGQIQSRQGDVLKATFTVVSSIDTGTGIAVDESYAQGRVWRMGLLFSRGGDLLYFTSTDGINFS